MSSGKPKTKTVKPQQASSVYGGVNEFNVSSPFASSTANLDQANKQFDITASLAPELQTAFNTSAQGLNNNLSFLGQTPTQQLQDLSSGNNSFYNLQSELNRRAAEGALGTAQQRFSANGLENSTVRGAYEGQLQGDSMLQDLATRQAALEYQNQTALQNLGGQNQTLGLLNSYVQQPAAMAQQNALTAFGQVDNTSQFNANQANQVGMFNAQQANQAAQLAAQQRNALMGNLVGAGLSAAAIPFTGGLSGLGMLGSLGGASTAGSVPSLIGTLGLGQGLMNSAVPLSYGSTLSPFSPRVF